MCPPHFLKGLKVPFFMMKSALFAQANVAVNTKLTSKVPILFRNFQVFKKIWSKTYNFGMVRRENFFPPRHQHFCEKNFRCPFQHPKMPLEAGAPNLFWCFLRPCSLSLSGVQVIMHPASVVGQTLFYDQPWFSNPRTTLGYICMRENRLFQLLSGLAIVTYTPYEILVSNSGMD
jgi:hypothetical protein